MNTIGENEMLKDKFIKSSLSNDEHIMKIFKVHWIATFTTILFVLFGIFFHNLKPLNDNVETFFEVIAAIFYLGAFNRILVFWGREQGLTNKRIILKKGIIARNTSEMNLSAIENVTIQQGVWGRILGYGKVRISGRGHGDVLLDLMVDPLDLKMKIESISV